MGNRFFMSDINFLGRTLYVLLSLLKFLEGISNIFYLIVSDAFGELNVSIQDKPSAFVLLLILFFITLISGNEFS